MIIYPAIDLKSGECVRLYQGRFDAVTTYETDPVKFAKSLVKQGTQYLHIIDLDGAKQGEPVHADLIAEMVQATGLLVQTGGGIRQQKQIQALLNKGINRVIIGSLAVMQPELVFSWLQEFGPDRIVLAFDIRMDNHDEPKVAMHGWQSNSAKSLWQLLEDFQAAGLRHVLCTDISRDGTLFGPNFKLYQQCIELYPAIQFQASGGISQLNDLTQLASMQLAGAVVGKALYENKFSLAEALALTESTQC